jgi:hypothetical protein
MEIGEFFSKQADMSAANMEQWTVKMHNIAARTEQETVAMGIITFFTLVFLPGTFVAVSIFTVLSYATSSTSLSCIPTLLTECCHHQTFFSSGIVSFDHSAEGSEMGDWEFRWPALQLFLVMSLPLMGLTMVTWYCFRRYAGRQSRIKTLGEELPIAEKPAHIGLGIS